MGNKYLTQLLFGAASRLTCGLDLELVSKNGQDWLELGNHRINFNLLELEGSNKLVLAMQSFVKTLPVNTSTLQEIALFSKWFVSGSAHLISKNELDFVLSAELLLHLTLDVDSEALALVLDSMIASLEELAAN